MDRAAREAMLEAKREERRVKITQRIDWYDARLTAGVKQTAKQRVGFAAQTLRDAIVVNIAKPVHKRKSLRGRRRTVVEPSSRSKPGEFPRADTTRLMKDIFWEKIGDGTRARVGTTLDYGLFLELFMDRSFILRTFNELKTKLGKILGTDLGGTFKVT